MTGVIQSIMTDPILSGGIFLLASFVQGLTGFGASLVAIPLLCMIMDVKIAVPLCLLNNAMMSTYMAYELRGDLQWSRILPLLAGSLPGVYAGVWLLKQVDPSILKMFLGIILILYGVSNLLFKFSSLKMPNGLSYLVGFFAGTCTGAVSAGGPPVIIYTALTDWSKNVIKATLTGFFLINSYIAIGAQTYNGLVTGQVLQIFAVTIFFVGIGTFSGLKMSDRINRELSLKLVYIFLILMGLVMFRG